MAESVKSFWNKITDQWKTFFEIMASPPVLISLIITIIATYLSIRSYSDIGVTLVISSIASITAGVLGGIIWDRYRTISGDTILQKKGKSAVRNLSLVAEQLGRLKIRLFNLKDKKEKFPFDEVDHHVITIEKSVISGIEDWIDMVPELEKVSNLAQSITEKTDEIQDVMHEKMGLEKKLKLQDKAQKTEVDSLKREIEEKDKEILRINSDINKLRTQQVSIGGPTISSGISIGSMSPSLSPSMFGNLTVDINRVCSSCGRIYTPTLLSTDKCEECSKKWY